MLFKYSYAFVLMYVSTASYAYLGKVRIQYKYYIHHVALSCLLTTYIIHKQYKVFYSITVYTARA